MPVQIITKFHYSRVLRPEKLTHHTALEVIWTIIPTLVVVLIAIPSLTLIYSLDQHTERPGRLLIVGWKASVRTCSIFCEALDEIASMSKILLLNVLL